MSVSSNWHNQCKGDRLKRINRVKEMRKNKIPLHIIAQEMGISMSTLKGYIHAINHLEDDEVKIKKPPAERKCLGCGKKFRPKSFGIFMCSVCNDFASGAMV